MASSRKPAPDVRSGRIKSDDASGTNAITIVNLRTGSYRIFNTGENEFTVKPDGQDPIVLTKRNAVDVRTSDTSIVIEGAAGEAIKGIYECISLPSSHY